MRRGRGRKGRLYKEENKKARTIRDWRKEKEENRKTYWKNWRQNKRCIERMKEIEKTKNNKIINTFII